MTLSTGSSPTGSFYVSSDGGKTFAPAVNSPSCEVNGDCHGFGQIHAAPGYANHVWSSAAKDGLWYTTDAGQSACSTTVSQYHNGQKGSNTNGIAFANQDSSGDYQVEIAIPWTTLGVTPSANAIIGLDLDVWQNYSSNVKNKLYWNNASDNDWNNPSLFGEAVLQS